MAFVIIRLSQANPSQSWFRKAADPTGGRPVGLVSGFESDLFFCVRSC